MVADFTGALVLLLAPLLGELVVKGFVDTAIQFIDIHGMNALLQAVVFSLQTSDRLFVLTSLVFMAFPQRPFHPIQLVVVEFEFVKKISEFGLEHFLADVWLVAGLLVAGAAIIDVLLLLDVADQSAAAMAAGHQT